MSSSDGEGCRTAGVGVPNVEHCQCFRGSGERDKHCKARTRRPSGSARSPSPSAARHGGVASAGREAAGRRRGRAEVLGVGLGKVHGSWLLDAVLEVVLSDILRHATDMP